MKDLAAILEDLRRLKPELAKRYPIKELGVFGSYARGEQRPDSDLDVLVDFDGRVTLFGLCDIEREISREIGVSVDLVPRRGLKPRIGQRVLSEMVPV